MPTPGLIPLPLSEVSEGGIFGPSSFEGYIADAAFTLHRQSSSPPSPEQEKLMRSGKMSPGYFIALWVRFIVTKALEPVNWEGEEFEHHWGLGKTSSANLYVCNPPNVTIPCGFPPDGKTNPFDALAIYAQGIYEVKGESHILTLDKEPAAYRGRWYQPYKDGKPSQIPYNLNNKAGFVRFADESAPAIKDTAPELVISMAPDKKTGVVRETLNIWMTGEDGDPMGADFFIGLSGTWDTKKFSFQMKGQAEESEQKVLYLSQYAGRVEVSKAGTPPAQAAKGAGKAASGKSKAATPAPAAAPEPATDEASSLDTTLMLLITSNLPDSGHIAEGPLARAVLVNSEAFSQAEIPAAQLRFVELLKSAPATKDAAQTLALVDPDNPPAFTYNQKLKQVEKYTA